MTDFLVYDRKEDESLPRDAIEEAIVDGLISVDEIVGRIRSEIEYSVESYRGCAGK